MRVKIGIDVDDTITNSYDLITDYVAKAYKMKKEDIIEKGYSYDFMLTHPDIFPDYDQFCATTLRNIVINATTKPNVREIIKLLHEQGHTIEIITARNYGEYRDPVSFTKTFLDKKGIYYDNINVNVDNKGVFCHENGFDLLIDDSVKHCTFAKENGVKCILIDNTFNKTAKDFVRAKDWLDVYDIIINNKF